MSSSINRHIFRQMTRFLDYNNPKCFHHLVIRSWKLFPSGTKVMGWAINVRSGIKVMGSLVAKECSPIFAQRVQRTYRVLALHSKLWSNHLQALRPLDKKALFSFLLVSLCDSKKVRENIKYSELVEHLKDLEFIHGLTSATVVCPHCKDRLVVDKKVPNVKYCYCPGQVSAYDKKVKGYGWTAFVETPDLLVWRMQHPDQPGLYMYKVYGYYDDISADEFLNAQLDIEYRKKWDDHCLQLEIVESDKGINQDVIYWEMKWPTMFSNRDYVFARRHLVDKDKQSIIIISKAVGHPDVPERKGIHRVKEYWSVMAVKSVNGLSSPGVEFGLTYFDNPGVSLPQWMQNWASMTAIPDYLDKQRNAARDRKKGKTKKSLSKSHKNSSQNSSDNKEVEKTKEKNAQDNNNKNNNNQIQDSSSPTSSSTSSSSSSSPYILSQYFKETILQNVAAQCSSQP